MISPKLVKIVANVLCQSLSNAINNNLSKGIFLGDAKISMVLPLHKGTSNKNDISNFGPIRTLTTFSKYMKELLKK